MASVLGGLVYFAITFAVGFLLGVVRQLFLAPALGDTAGLLIEAPLILVTAYYVARAVVRGLPVPSTTIDRLVVGGVGLSALLATEYAMAAVLRGWTLQQWLEALATRNGAISLAMFSVFAVIPLIVQRQLVARN